MQTRTNAHTQNLNFKRIFSFKDKEQKQGFVSYCSHYNRISDRSNFRVEDSWFQCITEKSLGYNVSNVGI